MVTQTGQNVPMEQVEHKGIPPEVRFFSPRRPAPLDGGTSGSTTEFTARRGSQTPLFLQYPAPGGVSDKTRAQGGVRDIILPYEKITGNVKPGKRGRQQGEPLFGEASVVALVESEKRTPWATK